MNVMNYAFEGAQVRTVAQGGEPWFVAKDVCDVLNIRTDTVNAILDDDEFSNTNTIGIKIDNVNRGLTVINESGLYSLVLRSRKPEAKRFKKWITSEVLPSIRKNGGYIASHANDTPELIMARALQVAQTTIERHQAQLGEANRQIKELAPDAEYARKVVDAKNLHTVDSIAVYLGISAIKLNRFLKEQGWIYKQGGIWYPTVKIRNKDLCGMKIVPYAYDEHDNVKTREHLKWTEKGRRAVIELWNREQSAVSGEQLTIKLT
jgi:prophage antirepressor-like protein